MNHRPFRPNTWWGRI